MNPRKVGRYATVGVVSRGPDEDVLTGEHGSRQVAIRLFHGREREAILEDARRIAGLSHANIAHQEVGLHADAPFLAAEVVGESLANWSRRQHGLHERLVVIEGVATGLAHAHAHGIAHGRLTPERIAVGGDGVPRIWGFGVRGTAPERDAAYTAPEVEAGTAPTGLADVYSAGVVFYELLAGETPRGEAPPPLRELRKDIPKDLADAIMACRERSADWRPKDFDYLLSVVLRLRGRQPPPKAAALRRVAVTATARPRAETRRAAPPLLPIAIGVVTLLGGAAALYLHRGPEPTPRPAPPTAPTPSPSTAATAPASLPTPMPPPATAPPTLLATPAPVVAQPSPAAPRLTPLPSPRASATPGTPPTRASLATPPPAPTLPPARATTLAPQHIPPPVTAPPATAPPAAAGPALIRAVSPPTLRRGQKTLVDVRGQGLYKGLGAALLRGGRPADGLRAREHRFVSASLVQVFIEVDAGAAAGSYDLILSDGTSVTNAVRFDVAK